jgi:hypothetical protein
VGVGYFFEAGSASKASQHYLEYLSAGGSGQG